MTRSRQSYLRHLTSQIEKITSYARRHRQALRHAAFIGGLAGIVIAYSLPPTYTVEITAVPKVTWERTSVSRRDKLLSVLSGTLVNNNPDDPDCFRPTLYPYIVASTPFLLRMAETPVRTLNDTCTYTLGHYVNHMQRTPWWNYVLGAPQLAISYIRDLMATNSTDTRSFKEETSEYAPTPYTSVHQYSKKQLRTAARIYRCLDTEMDIDKYVVSFRATLQDPMVAALVADSFRLHMQHYIQHYRDVKARRYLAYCDSLLQQARTDYFMAQEALATYNDSHKSLNGFQNRQEESKLMVKKNETYRYYLQMESNYREALNRISAVTPLYSVITPAEVPQEPDGPGRPVIVLLTTLLAIGCVPLGSYLKPRIQRLRYLKRKRHTVSDNLQPIPNRPTA